MFAVWVGAAYHAQQQIVAHRAGHLCRLRQIGQIKKNTFASATTYVARGNFDLWNVRHGFLLVNT
jgi:hypothetical protein